MDKRIRELYNDSILEEAATRYDIDLSKIKKLGGFESFIYEYKKAGEQKILRIAHSYHRSMDDLHAEMEWVNYLGENGANVAAAVLSESGILAEKIDIGDTYFIASSIEKADGIRIKKEHWDKELFKAWGRAIGKLHKLTKEYKPSGVPRFQWYDEYLVKDFAGYLPKDQTAVIEASQAIIEKLKKLETGKDNYGLIHTDVHHGNFFIDKGEITIFDFDDCAYKHFISDIAIAVFYSMLSKNDFVTKEDFAEFYLGNFMEGYVLENVIEDRWLKMLPDFLKLREIILYIAISRSHDPADPDEWCINYMKKHRTTIEKGIPLLSRAII